MRIKVLPYLIGAQFLIRKHQLEFVHFNDCIAFDIPPLSSRAEAEAMVNALVAEVKPNGWHKQTTEALLDEVAAYYPSFIQFAFSRIKAARVVDTIAIEDLFAEQIRPAWDSTFFDQFDARLKIYDAPLRDLSRKVFKQIVAADSKPVKRAQFNEHLPTDDLSELLNILR
jgi:hypothetical protein